MFNDCNPHSNGEAYFYKKIRDSIKVIFDVGTRNESLFIDFTGEVHYFEPVKKYLDELQTQEILNKKSYFNNFGLGKIDEKKYFYPQFESFYDRINSCNFSDDSNKILLDIKNGSDYIKSNNITHIDFLKIDTEGSEYDVILGLEEYLPIIDIIQFEYGGTFKDNNVRLIDLIDYLKSKGFHSFSYLYGNGEALIDIFHDHYNYCNIVCYNSRMKVPHNVM